jgi:hypothetical protein
MGRPEKGSAQEQVHFARSAERRVFDLCHAFNEVMTGPNPLSKDEIRGLIEKRPELYSVLRKWVA